MQSGTFFYSRAVMWLCVPLFQSFMRLLKEIHLWQVPSNVNMCKTDSQLLAAVPRSESGGGVDGGSLNCVIPDQHLKSPKHACLQRYKMFLCEFCFRETGVGWVWQQTVTPCLRVPNEEDSFSTCKIFIIQRWNTFRGVTFKNVLWLDDLMMNKV